MAIHIKNVETERKARELATLTGGTLTGVIDQALEQRLAEERSKQRRPKPTVAEMIAATEEFRRKAGFDDNTPKITRADFDALYDFIDEEIERGR